MNNTIFTNICYFTFYIDFTLTEKQKQLALKRVFSRILTAEKVNENASGETCEMRLGGS